MEIERMVDVTRYTDIAIGSLILRPARNPDCTTLGMTAKADTKQWFVSFNRNKHCAPSHPNVMEASPESTLIIDLSKSHRLSLEITPDENVYETDLAAEKWAGTILLSDDGKTPVMTVLGPRGDDRDILALNLASGALTEPFDMKALAVRRWSIVGVDPKHRSETLFKFPAADPAA